MSIKKGRVAVVTGAGYNNGKAIAISLAKAGAKVIVQDSDYSAAVDTQKLISEFGIAEAIGGNVSSPEDCRSIIDLAVATFGTVDILVNAVDVCQDQPITEMSDSQWHAVLSENLSGAFYCSREALKVMIKNKYGRIVNISSIDYVGNKNKANYAAAKAGLIALANTITLENAANGITANCVCPGNISQESGYFSKENQAWLEELKEHTRLGTPGTPEDVAFVVNTLVGEEASFITGRAIAVDGGYGRIRI